MVNVINYSSSALYENIRISCGSDGYVLEGTRVFKMRHTFIPVIYMIASSSSYEELEIWKDMHINIGSKMASSYEIF